MERQELSNVLTDAMRASVGQTLLDGRVRGGRGVKSRILEAHAPDGSPDGVDHVLRNMAEVAGLRTERHGDDLWSLTSDDDAFFVDAFNPRFWLMHTTASAATLSALLRRHLLPNPRIDQAWLSSDLLRQQEGERRWLRSSFSSDFLQPQESGANAPRRWKVQIEGENPDELFGLIRTTDRYHAGAALTAVGSLLEDEHLGRAQVAADYQGGFAATGSSFHLVAGALWRAVDRYEDYVRGLEATYRTGTVPTETMGMTIEGEVAFIEFPHPVGDLDAMVTNLFSCREPFRLWAVPREIAPGQWEANAVDLHVGHSLRLELTPRWLRVFLTPDTCGNTLARLVANLQHRFDARTHVPLSLAS